MQPRDARPGGYQVGALTAACTGFALALVGLMLPWAQFQPTETVGPGRIRATAFLTEFEPSAGVMAGGLLVLSAVLLGVGLASDGRMALRALAVAASVCSFVPVFMVTATLYGFRGRQLVIVDPATATPVTVTVGDILPAIGGMLYLFGMLLLSTGAVLAVGHLLGNEDPFAGSTRTVMARLRTLTWWSAGLLALASGFASLFLPWHRLRQGARGETELSPGAVTVADVEAWVTVYRVGLVVVLLLYLGTQTVPRISAILRIVGMVSATAVGALLLTGASGIWLRSRTGVDRSLTFAATVEGGSGLVAALLTMVLAVLTFALTRPAGGRGDRAGQLAESRREDKVE